MDEVILRQACAADLPAIRTLIYQVGINPLGLNWRRFLVAETQAGEFIGCGQLKPHFDGSMELASLAVVPAWRGRGVARRIIQQLMRNAPRPLYLTCLAHLGAFYEKFGFRVLGPEEMPPYFRRLYWLARLAGKFLCWKLLVMKAD
ncbi:MAG: GNAT family N-acetyltransferase [Anaerolineae bacterium]|nr:MAG: GNAT family N-acetyltransferase [Anaerolineae bacterium]